MNNIKYLISSLLSLSILISACIPKFENFPINNGSGLVETAAAQTVSAFQTQEGINTLVAQLTQAVESTPTPIVITETLEPLTSTPTSTEIPPTATSISPIVTATTMPCNWARYISDVTIPDNSTIKAGSSFTKTWRLQNVGSCSWNSDYSLVFVSSSSLGGPAAVKIGQSVNPGNSVDVSVKLTAPNTEGVYTGNWMLRNDYGVNFGLGANASNYFWVKIKVTDSPQSNDNPRKFALSYNFADWKSTKGTLSSPSDSEDFKNGSVTRTSSPRFESGYTDDEPTLITIPSEGKDGMITGVYPAVRIKSGDRFRAVIGCLYDSKDCDVTFQLNYNIKDSNAIYNLGSWHEKYEGMVQEITVDLSALDGKDVEFHLVVQNNGSSKDDRAFWLMPGIQ